MTQELIVFTEPMLRANPSQETYFLAGAGNLTSTSQCSIGVGKDALASLTSGGHNIGFGYRSLVNATTPGSNVFVGSFTGEDAIDVIDSVAVGFGALRHATTGIGGVAVGIYALEDATNVGNNTAVGDSCFRHTTTGEQNVGLGYTCADSNLTGSYNVYLGQGCAFARTQGDYNFLGGYRAGADAVLAGSRNVGIGRAALLDHTGDDVVAVGQEAGRGVTTAGSCVFVGALAGTQSGGQKIDAVNATAIGAGAVTTKDDQVVIGNAAVTETVLRGAVSVGGAIALRQFGALDTTFVGGAGPDAEPTGTGNLGLGVGALDAVTGGSANVALGGGALAAVVGGADNVAVGAGAGGVVTSGSANTFLGDGAGHDAGQKVDAVNSTAVGAGAFTTKDNQVVLGATTVVETLVRGKAIVNPTSGVTATPGRLDVQNPKPAAGVANPAEGNLVVTDTTSAAANVGGSIVFRGCYTGTTVTEAAAIQALKSNGTAGQFGFDMSFHTRVNGGTNTEKMRIASAGNVGIGEASPDYKLDVNGPIGFTPGDSVTPVDNGDVVFELTNNTTLTIKAKGSDGVVRSVALTLA
jgi:hypothetical protein